MSLTSDIERVVAAANFGEPSAAKRGRNPSWPYVPVITGLGHFGDGSGQRQIRGLAFATRDEAVAAAKRHIAQQRAELARHLAEPRYRALRESYGLPREV